MYLGRGLCRATRAKVHAHTHMQKKKENKISQSIDGLPERLLSRKKAGGDCSSTKERQMEFGEMKRKERKNVSRYMYNLISCKGA